MGAHSKLAKLDTAEALRVIVRACGCKERSSAEIRTRLIDKGFDQCTTEEALSKAIGYGYVNDQRFKESLIRMRIDQGKGVYGILKELELHGFSLNEGDCCAGDLPNISDISEDIEFKRALNFLQKKPPRAKNLLNASYGKLLRNGYSFDIAKKAAFEFTRRINASQNQC